MYLKVKWLGSNELIKWIQIKVQINVSQEENVNHTLLPSIFITGVHPPPPHPESSLWHWTIKFAAGSFILATTSCVKLWKRKTKDQDETA